MHMKTWIALFRGINVGGTHKLPMKELRELLESIGCSDVKTYIQSGNAVFRSPVADPSRLATRISKAVATGHGFEPRVLVLSRDELQEAAAANPFAKAAAAVPKSVHLFFLGSSPKDPNLAPLQSVKAATEAFALNGRMFYLHTPDGFGTSKLAERVERLLGVAATARNWRTVTTLLEMTAAS